jgi:hypothetical protein
MRYTLDAMLPERAFRKKVGGYAPETLEGGGGNNGGGGSTSSTVTNTNIPDYARPYVENMLGATQQQLFNTKQNEDGTTQITGMKPYTPYGLNQATGQAYSPQEMAGNMQVAQNAVAGFSPLQQQAQQGVANLQTPGQIGDASNMAKMAGLGALGASYNPMSAGYNSVYGSQARAAQLGNAPQAQAATGSSQNMQAATGNAQDMQAAQLGNSPQAQAAAMQAAQLGNTPEAQAAQFNGPQGVNAQNVGTQDYTGQNVQNYMSPYMQNVVDTQMREANRNYDISGAQQQSRATQSGAFGGGREAIMAAENERNRNTALGGIQAQGLQNAFQNAQQQFNTQQNANLQAQQANQGANLQAGMANQQMGYNTGLQNAQLQQQAGLANQQLAGQYGLAQGQMNQAANQFNAANQQQAGLANQQLAGQYGLQQGQMNQAANAANQQAQNQFGMANLSNQQAANVANQQAGNQFGLANLANQQQTGLANQALQGQYGLQQGQFGQAVNLANQQSRNQASLANQQAALQAQQANIGQQQFGANYGMQGLQQANQAASTLGQLGGQQLAAQQGILGLQNQVGAQQQAQNQNVINQAIQNYAVGQQYPQQQLAFMNAQLRGLPLQSGSTQMYQAAPNPVSQLAGLGAAGLGAYGAAGGFKAKKGGVVKMATGGINMLSKEQLTKEKDSPYISPMDKLAVMNRMDTNQKIESNPEASKVMSAGITNIPTGDMVPQQFNDGGIVAFKAGGPKGEVMKQNADAMDYQDLIRQRLEDMEKGPDPFLGSEQTRQKHEDILQRREELAPYMSLIKGGLKTYGGTSPYANANIGAGAESGLEDYAKSQTAADAERKGLLANQTDTEKNRYARKMANLDALIKAQGGLDAKTLGTLYAKQAGHGNAIAAQSANYIKAYNAFLSSVKNEKASILKNAKQNYENITDDQAEALAHQYVMQNMPGQMKDILGFNNMPSVTPTDIGKPPPVTPVAPTNNAKVNPTMPVKPNAQFKYDPATGSIISAK